MTEELIPADIDLLPVGSIMPFPRGQVPDFWIELDGNEILYDEAPELFEHFTHAHGQALELWKGWGGYWGLSKDPETGYELITPKLDRDQVVQMLWGVVYKDAPDVVLAIKADRDEFGS